MNKRYICADCKNIETKSQECEFCGEKMDEIIFPFTFRTVLPYISAAVSGLFLLGSYLFQKPILIWFSFPFIALGLILDHFYQKELDRKAKDIIKNRNKNYK